MKKKDQKISKPNSYKEILAFEKELDSTRTEEELELLKNQTTALIDTIESAEVFPTRISALCDWCEFKSICREWAHLSKLEDKPTNEYLNDPGVDLVNRYIALRNKRRQGEDRKGR